MCNGSLGYQPADSRLTARGIGLTDGCTACPSFPTLASWVLFLVEIGRVGQVTASSPIPFDLPLYDVFAPCHMSADHFLDLPGILCPHQTDHLLMVFYRQMQPGVGAKDDHPVAIDAVSEASHKFVEPGILCSPMQCILEAYAGRLAYRGSARRRSLFLIASLSTKKAVS